MARTIVEEEAGPGLQDRITAELRATNAAGGYLASIVCTHEGLLVAADGRVFREEQLAGFTSLFDDIVVRAGRDLGIGAVDEVALRDRELGRLVIRPVNDEGLPRMFLVVLVPSQATWRRNTNTLLERLRGLLEPVLGDSGGA